MVISDSVKVKTEKQEALVNCKQCGKPFDIAKLRGMICLPCLFPTNAINPTKKVEEKPKKKPQQNKATKNKKYFIPPKELESIKKAYEPLLPMPPVNCHKIIAEELKMDGQKVYKAIGIIRKQMKLSRFIEREGYNPKV
jgi:hypothetical protein